MSSGETSYARLRQLQGPCFAAWILVCVVLIQPKFVDLARERVRGFYTWKKV